MIDFVVFLFSLKYVARRRLVVSEWSSAVCNLIQSAFCLEKDPLEKAKEWHAKLWSQLESANGKMNDTERNVANAFPLRLPAKNMSTVVVTLLLHLSITICVSIRTRKSCLGRKSNRLALLLQDGSWEGEQIEGKKMID